MRHARFLSDLTDKQAEALKRCSTATVPATTNTRGGFSSTTGIAQSTIRSLYVHGYIEIRRGQRWKPTQRGWEVLTADEPRLLAARSQRGYVLPGRELADSNGALFGEPEAVDEVTQARLSEEARDRDRARANERALHERLYQAELAAEAAGVDVTRQRLAIERRVRAIENMANQRNAA